MMRINKNQLPSDNAEISKALDELLDQLKKQNGVTSDGKIIATSLFTEQETETK